MFLAFRVGLCVSYAVPVYETKIVLRVPVPMTALTRGILLAINDHYAGDANQILSLVKHEY